MRASATLDQQKPTGSPEWQVAFLGEAERALPDPEEMPASDASKAALVPLCQPGRDKNITAA